jgi:hypothetical protein
VAKPGVETKYARNRRIGGRKHERAEDGVHIDCYEVHETRHRTTYLFHRDVVLTWSKRRIMLVASVPSTGSGSLNVASTCNEYGT